MANNKIAYGIAKANGIDTSGMTPKQVWAALDKKGVNVSKDSESEELKDFFDGEKKEPKVEAFFENKKVPDVGEFFEKDSSELSGAINGALNSNSKEASKHAKTFYAEIRKRTSDVQAISKNTGMSKEDVERVKNHVFMEKHELDGGIQYFDPSYDKAQSWQRLIEGKNIQPHDITLLKHELEERRIMKEEGLDYKKAHDKASLKYDYNAERKEYNSRMKKEKEKK